MDRVINYVGEVINAEDLAYLNQRAMVGIAKLSSAVLGVNTLLNDLSCVPDTPASLNVVLNPGEIYTLVNLEPTAFGPLPSDTAHQIVKQGIVLDPQIFNCPAPITPGDSVNYLIQVQFQENDGQSETRAFYAASPQTVNTARFDQLVTQLVAGIPAPTGTQVTPAVTSGWVGAWVITVTNGQSQILSGDIAEYPGAPFINGTLTEKITEAEADARYVQLATLDNSPITDGYQHLPNGLILQWGKVIYPATGIDTTTVAVTFPIPFTVGVFSITTSYSGAVEPGWGAMATAAQFVTLTGFSWEGDGMLHNYSISGDGYWIAIGK